MVSPLTVPTAIFSCAKTGMATNVEPITKEANDALMKDEKENCFII